MSPSSTSNSETRWSRRFDGRAAAVALVMLLAIELGVVRSGYIWKRAPNTMVGAFQGIESHVLAKAPPPRVVFMGSSRMRDAVEPRQLEQVLGFDRGGVLNLGLTGGTPYEALLYYRKYRSLLKQARVLVLGVEDWYWNEGLPPDDVERAYATFDDRWRWFQRRHQIGDLIGGVWRTTELQEPLTRFGLSFIKGVKNVKYVEDRVVWREPSEVRDIGPETTDVDGALALNLQSLKLGPMYEEAIRALVDDARADGLSVILAELPLRRAYCDARAKHYPTVEPYLHARVDALVAERSSGVSKFYGCGPTPAIPDDRYYDYGHLTEDGVRRMSAYWAELLTPLLR